MFQVDCSYIHPQPCVSQLYVNYCFSFVVNCCFSYVCFLWLCSCDGNGDFINCFYLQIKHLSLSLRVWDTDSPLLITAEVEGSWAVFTIKHILRFCIVISKDLLLESVQYGARKRRLQSVDNHILDPELLLTQEIKSAAHLWVSVFLCENEVLWPRWYWRPFQLCHWAIIMKIEMQLLEEARLSSLCAGGSTGKIEI